MSVCPIISNPDTPRHIPTNPDISRQTPTHPDKPRQTPTYPDTPRQTPTCRDMSYHVGPTGYMRPYNIINKRQAQRIHVMLT